MIFHCYLTHRDSHHNLDDEENNDKIIVFVHPFKILRNTLIRILFHLVEKAKVYADC